MAAHAAIQYAVDYPHDARSWQQASNSIVLLGVRNEDELFHYYNIASCLTGVSLFKEPDINNEATSFACVMPGYAQVVFKKLRLLLKTPSSPRGGEV